jgi:hypothetical protein
MRKKQQLSLQFLKNNKSTLHWTGNYSFVQTYKTTRLGFLLLFFALVWDARPPEDYMFIGDLLKNNYKN